MKYWIYHIISAANKYYCISTRMIDFKSLSWILRVSGHVDDDVMVSSRTARSASLTATRVHQESREVIIMYGERYPTSGFQTSDFARCLRQLISRVSAGLPGAAVLLCVIAFKYTRACEEEFGGRGHAARDATVMRRVICGFGFVTNRHAGIFSDTGCAK